MKKMMPAISKYMTAMPHTIGHDTSLNAALAMMREYGIRHLPVLKGTELVGVISERDVKFASGFKGADELRMDDVMVDEPYAVEPETPVADVVKEMAAHKFGCALVRQRNGKFVGIFTATDSLRVLHETLETFYRPAPDLGLFSRG